MLKQTEGSVRDFFFMESFWQGIKKRLQVEIPEKAYRLWIEPLEVVRAGEEEILLSCPSQFFLNWVKERYVTAIRSVANEMTSNPPRIGFQVSPPQTALPPSSKPEQFFLPGFARPGCLRLNGSFTFDQFVTGPTNNFAFQASLALASDKNMHNNALFLFSHSGLGKTHLSQAVGNYLIKHKPAAKVLYLSVEDFTNEMIASLKTSKMESFKDKYRKHCDFLLLEEVNFLSGKETTQTELGYTLDALFNYNKKVIFTSSLPPKDIPHLGNKLKSRFSSALLSAIEPPDFETRLGIVEKKTTFLGLGLNPEVKAYLASQPFRDVRQLESCLIRMSAQSSLLNQTPDLSLAEMVVREQIQERQELSIKAIKDLVGKYFRVSAEEMISKSRKKVHLNPRNLSIYLSKKFTNQTLENIGQAFNRDSTSVIYAVNAVEKGLKKNPELSRQVHFLTAQLEDYQKVASFRKIQ